MLPHPQITALRAGGRKERDLVSCFILLTALVGAESVISLETPKVWMFPWWGCLQPCSHQGKEESQRGKYNFIFLWT